MCLDRSTERAEDLHTSDNGSDVGAEEAIRISPTMGDRGFGGDSAVKGEIGEVLVSNIVGHLSVLQCRRKVWR